MIDEKKRGMGYIALFMMVFMIIHPFLSEEIGYGEGTSSLQGMSSTPQLDRPNRDTRVKFDMQYMTSGPIVIKNNSAFSTLGFPGAGTILRFSGLTYIGEFFKSERGLIPKSGVKLSLKYIS